MNKEKIIAHYDALAESRDQWMRKNWYYHRNIERLYQFLVPPSCKVLEIGCGTGNLLNSLNPSKGVGLDISPKMISAAKSKYPQLEFLAGDAEALNLNERFDYIVMSDAAGDLSDVWKAFREARKVCGPETRLIVTYYNYLWEPVLKLAEKFKLKQPQYYQNWLSLEDIAHLLNLNDFEVIKVGRKQLLPIFIPFISDLVNRYLAPLPIFRWFCLTGYVVAKYKSPSGRLTDSSVSVIVPKQNKKGTIEKIIEQMPSLGAKTEIIFVEGHSTDGTLEEIQRMIQKYPGKPIRCFVQTGRGKGDAVRCGFEAAAGDILMILDGDLSVVPHDLEKFYLAMIEDKGDMVMGNRLVYPMETQAMRFLNLLGNKFFSAMFSWLLDQRIKDTLCGTKVLFRENYYKIRDNRAYFGDFDPFGDFDLLFGAAKQNMRIVEIPVRYKERVYGTTNIKRFRHGFILLAMCIVAMKKIKFVK